MYCDVKTPDSLQSRVHTVCVHNNLCFVCVGVCVYMLRRLSTCIHVQYMYVYICTCMCLALSVH